MASTARTALSALAVRITGTIPTPVMNARISWDVINFTLSRRPAAVFATYCRDQTSAHSSLLLRSAVSEIACKTGAKFAGRLPARDSDGAVRAHSEESGPGNVSQFVPFSTFHCGRDAGRAQRVHQGILARRECLRARRRIQSEAGPHRASAGAQPARPDRQV